MSAKKPNSIPSHVGPLYPMALILLSIFLLVGVGATTNSFANSGLISLSSSPSVSHTCNLLDYLNCYYGLQYNQPTACNVNASTNNCRIGGVTGIAGIFNTQSPFTFLFSGDISGFIGSLFIKPTALPFSTLPGPSPFVNLTVKFGGGLTWINATTEDDGNKHQLVRADFHGSGTGLNVTDSLGNVVPFYKWNITDNTHHTLINDQVVTGMCWEETPAGTGEPGGSTLYGSYYFLGCQYHDALGGMIYYMVGYQGTALTDLSTTGIYAHFFDYNVTSCESSPHGGESGHFLTPTGNCYNTYSSLEQLPTSSYGGLGYIAGFFIGVVLLIIGLGIGIGAGGLTFNASLSSNSQGTRFAQVLGIFLTIYTPLASEFGTWLTSPLMGGTGLEILMVILVFGTGFFGVWWQTLSWR